jgi:mRNA interferase MazF
MKRGDIWWANLPPPSGSGPGYRRPVLIIQSNAFNESIISTVLVAVITSNLALADAPGNVRLSKSSGGLSKTSVVNVSQLFTMDRGLLGKRVGSLPSRAMQRVDAGLKLVLSL